MTEEEKKALVLRAKAKTNELERKEIIQELLSNPQVMLTLNKEPTRIAGPWLEARDEEQMINIPQGWWRKSPDGNLVVVIQPSISLEELEPKPANFTTYRGGKEYFDQVQYQEALNQFAKIKLFWKPWGYDFLWEHVFAETFEEAKLLANQKLRDCGILFFD